jgi:hypothetical protein
MHSDLRHAYAILGVTPGTPIHIVRRKYKRLVSKWHPDRFQKDAGACAEANERMRQINRAFQVIQRSGVAFAPAATNGPKIPERQSPFGAGLTPLERQEIIDAINMSRSPRDAFVENPWNCGASLGLVILNIAYVVKNHLLDIPTPPTSVFAVALSPVLLYYVWSDAILRRIFGWFWLILFVLLLPWFAIYMRGTA